LAKTLDEQQVHMAKIAKSHGKNCYFQSSYNTTYNNINDKIEKNEKEDKMTEREIALKMLRAFNDRFPKIQKILNDYIQQKLNTAFTEKFYGDFALWEHHLDKIATSDYLNSSKFDLNLGFILKETTIANVAKNMYNVKNIPFPKKKEEKDLEESTQKTIKTTQETPYCKKVRETLLKQIGAPSYSSWFEKLKITQKGDDEVEIETPNQFFKDTIYQRFGNVLSKICKNFYLK
jgi:hypothetical protein